MCRIASQTYGKSSMKPSRGACLISDIPVRSLKEKGHVREGAYSQNHMTNIFIVIFQSFYPICCKFNILFYKSMT